MKLTIDAINDAMKGNDFWLNPLSEKAAIVTEALKHGYLRRSSHTQVEWTEEGLAKARRELEGTIALSEVEKLVTKTYSDLVKSAKYAVHGVQLRDEILARLEKLR